MWMTLTQIARGTRSHGVRCSTTALTILLERVAGEGERTKSLITAGPSIAPFAINSLSVKTPVIMDWWCSIYIVCSVLHAYPLSS